MRYEAGKNEEIVFNVAYSISCTIRIILSCTIRIILWNTTIKCSTEMKSISERDPILNISLPLFCIFLHVMAMPKKYSVGKKRKCCTRTKSSFKCLFSYFPSRGLFLDFLQVAVSYIFFKNVY